MEPCDTCTGLIPAHAGKTATVQSRACQLEAHPRSRGENAPFAPKISLAWGSSPLTRGKLRVNVGSGGHGGLIPAHAGKTGGCNGIDGYTGAHPRSRGENQLTLSRAHLAAAHPRSRGENWAITRPASIDGGSSPLTRGKLAARDRRQVHSGLIPAHAGKTEPKGPRP